MSDMLVYVKNIGTPGFHVKTQTYASEKVNFTVHKLWFSIE